MRLVLAIVSFLLAAAMLAVGIVQRTILAPPDAVNLEVHTTTTAPLTIVEGATLLTHEGHQTLTISGPGTVTAAYGRSTDVHAWIGDAAYNLVTVDPTTGQLVSTFHPGTETVVPDPFGSDLWYDDYQDTGSLQITVTLPADDALLIASDGGEPAPSQLGITWPLDDSTPWSGVLIIGGAVLLVFGLIMLLIAIYRIRSNHGPRRKMPKLPKQRMIKSVRPATRTPAKTGTTTAIAILLALGAALAVPAATPARADTPGPTPSGQPTDEPTTPVPAVTAPQLDRIVDRVGRTIDQADTDRDQTAAATRMTGPALELKAADYRLLKKDKKASASSPVIPDDGQIVLELPQQVPADTPSWPRTVMVVVASPDSLATGDPAPTDSATPGPTATPTADPADPVQPPVVLLLKQDAPRDPYKVDYLLTVQVPSLPTVAASTDGAALLAPDSPLVSVAPQQVASGYADILKKAGTSAWYSRFDLSANNLEKAWGKSAQAAEQKKQAGLQSPNKVGYTTATGAGDVIALATADAGAIVAATVRQTMTVAPKEKGAKVIAQGDVLTLSGVERSAKGYSVTYGGEVLFLVPALDSDDPITVLAYSQGLLTATEIK